MIEGDPLRFQKLVELSGDILSIVTPDGGVVYLSPAFERITGIPLEIAVEGGAFYAMHPDDVPHVDQALRSIAAGGMNATASVAFRRRHADGHWIRLEAIGRNLIDDPAVRGIVVSSREITERHESESRFRALFEGTATAVTLRDLDQQLLMDCNEAAVRLFGCKSRAELLGTHPLALSPEVQPDGTPSPVAARIQIGRATDRKAYQFEWLYRKVTGELFPTEVQVTVLDLNGRKIFLSIITDLTATKAAERALVKAKEDAIAASLAKSAFLANMSHELRTPLNGVIGMVDLLSRTPLDERQRRYNAVARDSARLLLSVINDILDFSKIEAGKLDLDHTDFSFAEIVEEVVTILELGAEDKGLDLSCHSDPALSRPVAGDPARIRQVLVNLVNNAIKFTARGEVAVCATVRQESPAEVLVEVEVRDTGIGIAEDAQQRLFQPFSQVDASTTREHHGSGLGLAICRELIERMGGEIGVRSALGAGSTFWFTLPLSRPDPATSVDDGSALEAHLVGVRVLGVDDNATNREILETELRAAGMICETAADGPAALTALREATASAPFAIAILDHHMPGMDGIELARLVKADPLIQRTHLVMLGSVARPLDRAAQIAAGIAGYASKPIWRRQLLRVLTAVLEGRDAGADRAVAKDRDTSYAKAAVGRKILVVEDSPMSAEVAGEVLRGEGYAFDIAPDGARAVEAALREPYDLILMDCQLPVLDGYEATRRIRALEAEGRLPRTGSHLIPIVALTASATKGDLERCLAAGMNDHVSKPVDARRLLALIAAHLSHAKAAHPSREPPASPAHALRVADLAGALDRLLGNRGLLAQITARFVESVPADRARLAAAVELRDAKTLQFGAHRLRGQVVTFGADALGACAAALEDAAKRDDWAAAAAALRAIDQELARLLEALGRKDAGSD